MQSESTRQSEMTRRSPRSRRAWTVVLVTLGALVALCLLQLACRSGVTTAKGNVSPGPRQVDRRIIAVDGTARLDVTPDRVDLHITLTEQAKTPRAAAQAVQRRRKGLLFAMKRLGLPNKLLVISHLNLVPRYKRYGGAIEGYNGRMSFVVKILDPAQLTSFVEAAAVAGASHLHTRFRHSRMQEMKRKVRTMALKAAQAKAEQIGKVTGVKVGQVRSVREGSHGSWTGSRWGWGAANSVANHVSVAPGSSNAPGRPDAIRLHLTVNVRYAIR